MESRLYFLDVNKAKTVANATARTLVRLFNSSGEQIYQFASFQWGIHYIPVEHLRNELSYVTIESPYHTASGWGMKG